MESAYLNTTIQSQVIAKAVPLDEWPEMCPIDLKTAVGEVNPKYKDGDSLFQNDREGRVEWEGTKQDLSNNTTKSRNNVFSEDDVRGSKNDLL